MSMPSFLFPTAMLCHKMSKNKINTKHTKDHSHFEKLCVTNVHFATQTISLVG